MFNSFCAGQTTESKQVSINLSEQIFVAHKSRMSGLLKTQPIMPGLRFEATIVGEECGTLSTWGICGGQKNQIRRFERFWLLSSSSMYMTRDRLPSLRRCRIEVRDEMHPCQPGRMKWCRYEVGAARLVTNWCTAKLCIMHIHLPWGDDVMVMIVSKTQRPRKSEREKNGNDPCIFQRRILSTTWCEWGLRMQQSEVPDDHQAVQHLGLLPHRDPSCQD